MADALEGWFAWACRCQSRTSATTIHKSHPYRLCHAGCSACATAMPYHVLRQLFVLHLSCAIRSLLRFSSCTSTTRGTQCSDLSQDIYDGLEKQAILRLDNRFFSIILQHLRKDMIMNILCIVKTSWASRFLTRDSDGKFADYRYRVGVLLQMQGNVQLCVG